MNQPKLDKPGAGLTFPQNLYLPFMARRMSKRDTWEQSVARFERLGQKILDLVEKLDDKAMQTQVLVPKLTGLEDSSRYWSVAMTLEHLTIVGDGISQIIVLLSKNQPVPYEVDTAKVKPHAQLDATTVKRQFREMLTSVKMRLTNEIKDRDSKATHKHPWFGQFTAAQWAWLIGSHNGIHREQIKQILKGLTAQSQGVSDHRH